MNNKKKIIIVPHTHWDREWYLPFQIFRHELVKLIDRLLGILKEQDYKFMLDGQTVILEDYLEIRPERKKELIQQIKQGNLVVGPWYILPDEWLVSGESLIRNLEYSVDLSTEFGIPMMDIGYLPDQFGHSRAIPQLLGDLTNLKAIFLWRGVGPEIFTVPFMWQSHPKSTISIQTIYMPGGYGNAASLPEDYDAFTEVVMNRVDDLEPFSPVPAYLLMNGSDHLFPQAFVGEYAEKMRSENLDISLGFLTDYVNLISEEMKKAEYVQPGFAGEFRSPSRAPLLQDTYSARMWIKIWSQKVDDLLVNHAEPINTYSWLYLKEPYPSSFLKTGWKWHLRNQPHDSICGCSVDSTHEEMKARFSWAESIALSVTKEATESIQKCTTESSESHILVFNGTNASSLPTYVEVPVPQDIVVKGFRTPDGVVHEAYSMKSKEDIFFEITLGVRTAKLALKMFPGRKLMDKYMNGVSYYDGDEPGLLEIRIDVDEQPIGEFEIKDLRAQANELFATKKYKKIHVVASKPSQNKIVAVLPLAGWTFTELLTMNHIDEPGTKEWEVSRNQVANKFYKIDFNKDGTLTLLEKESEVKYERLHVFEDWGDRGDEYTFGRLGPEKARVKVVERKIIISNPIFAEIRQQMEVEVFEGLDGSRQKRVEKSTIDVESTFRFYRDLPRVEVTTKLTNSTRNHRLRVCFDMPFIAKHTQTSTHFGCITRQGNPEKIPDETELKEKYCSYPEVPSGIQPQKRFIRIDEYEGENSFSLFNKGLPEVELVDGTRLALTLLRSIDWLSRSDFPERPLLAGPLKETPEAQEIGTHYEFKYSFMSHSSSEPIFFTANHAESFAIGTNSIPYVESKPFSEITEPIVQIDNPWIRISSLRVRENAILLSLYNLSEESQAPTFTLSKKITSFSETKVDGTIKERLKTSDNRMQLRFDPFEIKMIRFDN
ncbi:MAG: glycoside hydrolase family 38 C-terminal domain-containing protein [Candidatus Thorarchaeota archaeon]